MKWIVALAALLCAAPSPHTGNFKHDEAAIVMVSCFHELGRVSGTAFKVSEAGYITALHVVAKGTCYIAGKPITITSIDEKHDYATLTGPPSPATLRTTCEGFRHGQQYAARGYGGGQPYNMFSPQIAFSLKMRGFQVLAGESIIPGMSGGPLIDGQGRAVGVVNMRWPNRSMPLSSTGFCKT